MEMLRLVLRVAPEYLIVALVKAGGAREERMERLGFLSRYHQDIYSGLGRLLAARLIIKRL